MEEVRETGAQDGTRSTTVGKTIWVADLADWLERYQGHKRTALLKHEQHHARRQAELGLGVWLLRYATQGGFARDEEEAGWRLELEHRKQFGPPVNVAGVVRVLRGYTLLATGGRLWSRAEAEAFVRDAMR